MTMYILIAALIACNVFWGIVCFRTLLKKPDGLLNVDTRDPDKDYYDFIFLIPTGEVPKRKNLKIEVKTKSQ